VVFKNDAHAKVRCRELIAFNKSVKYLGRLHFMPATEESVPLLVLLCRMQEQ